MKNTIILQLQKMFPDNGPWRYNNQVFRWEGKRFSVYGEKENGSVKYIRSDNGNVVDVTPFKVKK